ncbi:mitochondrial ribosomal S6 [Micractinium conductrix]|uniref:Mitochondrial ribosomal S6 n=1 Tax=Micractinium conductrix TaxID=554055 RepID=A0A2P6VMV6_9CHLO|nr:mitochondrial ribosomal S6 [Micractinium conductrix]|eukprot:PSC75436.1 mitochondrial ribosomal S6 [Micractinium conductrix]
MPLYELFAVAKPRLAGGQRALVEIMKAVGTQIQAANGVITDIKYYGERPLAYDIRQPGARYSEANMWQINFAASPKTLEEVHHTLRVDERMLRWLVVKRRPYDPLPSTVQVARAVEKVAVPLAKQEQLAAGGAAS